MVFPSLGCLTCKRRRVKCDCTLPTCGRCRKASRDCTWEPNQETSLPFRSENAFARGQPRRPRRHPANVNLQESMILTTPSSLVSMSLYMPVEVHAFHYWVENFTAWPNDLPDIGRECLTYALYYWGGARLGSSLHLAVSAYSLAVFGRAKRSTTALEDADRFYARSIAKTQKEIRELSTETMDQLILATILMTSYETIMYGAKRQFTQNLPLSPADEVGSRFWKNICHYEGTVGLLHVRQQKGCPQNLPLDRAVRRPIIRACILRGLTVQEWLQDGALYGEEGPTLRLDSLMIRVAALRSRSLKLLRKMNPTVLSPTNKLKDIAIEAQEVDVALASWPQGIPEGWKFSIHSHAEWSELTKSDLLYADYCHSYTTHGHAAVWNRYRAVRLIVIGIRMRSISALAQCGSPGSSMNTPLEACQETISSLATDMCYSVPFFFNLHNTIHVESGLGSIRTDDNVTCTEHEIVPKTANLLAWPLTVAISTEAVPEAPKQWLRRRLKTIADTIGDAVLHSIVEKEEFKF